jgi:hypothetical protein
MVLTEWQGMKPTSQLSGVGSREQTVVHMQKIMAATINDVIKVRPQPRILRSFPLSELETLLR